MWHILESFGRRVARRVTDKEAHRLINGVGGELVPKHIPTEYGTGLDIRRINPKGLVGYVSNKRTIYNYPLISVEIDGVEICRVTRKLDAFRIMQALKRDHKLITVRMVYDSKRDS